MPSLWGLSFCFHVTHRLRGGQTNVAPLRGCALSHLAAGLRVFWLVVSAYKFCGSQFSELHGVFAERRVEFSKDCFQFGFWHRDGLGAEFADAFVESWEGHLTECYSRQRGAIGGCG